MCKNFLIFGIFLMCILFKSMAVSSPDSNESAPLEENLNTQETDCESEPDAEENKFLLNDYSDFSLEEPIPTLLEPAVKLILQRYLYGLVHADIDLILSLTSDKIDLPYYDKGMTKEMQREFFSELFATYDIKKIKNVEELYCLNTGKLILFEGDRAMITVYARKTPPEPLKNWYYWEDFWGLKHHYFFERIDEKWYLIAFDIAYDPPDF